MLENITYIKPEIFLSIVAMVLLVFGVFNKDSKSIAKSLFVFCAFALIAAIILLIKLDGSAHLIALNGAYKIYAFNSGYVFDNLALFAKILICFAALASCIIAINSKFYAGTNFNCFEFPVILLLSTIGMMLLASSNDLLTFYIALELQSLALYVLVAINRDSEKATEAGVKYFVLGAMASGLILFGISLIYGFSGTTNLPELLTQINNADAVSKTSPAIIFGMVLVLAGLFFKLSAVPMHMWAPDVYEGASKVVVSFLATAPKIAALTFLIRLFADLNPNIFVPFSLIIILVAIASMVLGSFAALRQDNIKRLLAYSSVANIGYLLIPVAIGSVAAISSGLVYLVVYIVATLGVFAVISLVQNENEDLEKISDLGGLAKSNPVIALCLATFMFSIAGIPPMAGFFGKFLVFKEAMAGGYITLAIIGVLASVVSCFYYLRIIKVMYFDSQNANYKINLENSASIKILLVFIMSITLLMIFFADEVIHITKYATLAL
jgi:NADH-quinone oxidoreductase subunit N